MNKEEEYDKEEMTFLPGDPPPASVGRRGYTRSGEVNPFWIHVKERLDAYPGRWAMVVRNANRGVYTRFKKGAIPGIDPERYEATCRAIESDPKRVTVYMRYVGSGDAD